jgi:hypothetical protein
MHKKLTWIAVAGFAASAIFLGGAWLLSGGGSLRDVAQRYSQFGLPRCGDQLSGQSASREIAWDGGDRVGIDVPATVRYSPGNAEQVKVTGDASLISHVRVTEGKIKLDCVAGRFTARDLDITLPGRSFRTFSLAGITSLILSDIDQPELNLNLAGASTVSAAGKAERLAVNAAGLSDAKLGELPVKEASLNLAGKSTIEVAVQDNLRVNSVGFTTVILRTEPQAIRTNIVGSGRVIHKAP